MSRSSIHRLLVLSMLCWVCRPPLVAFAFEGGSNDDGGSDNSNGGGGEGDCGGERHHDVTSVLREMLQVLHDREQHTKLYERVALLEDQLNRKEQHEKNLQETAQQLQEKILLLEAKVPDIPKFNKRLDELEDRVTQSLQEYENKLSAMGGEVIRLKNVENQRVAMSQSLLQIRAKPTPAASELTKGFSLLTEKKPTKTGLSSGLVSETSRRPAPSSLGLVEGEEEAMAAVKAARVEAVVLEDEDSEEKAEVDESGDTEVVLSADSNDFEGSGSECPSKDSEVLAAFIGGQCLYFPQGPPMDWTSAQRHCHALGGAIATPRDIWPLRRYIDTASDNIDSLWLGGSYQASSGKWQWTGGERSGMPISFKGLATGTSLSNLLEEEVEENEDEDVSRNFVQEVLTHVSRHRLSLRSYSSSPPAPFSSSSSSNPSFSSSINGDNPSPLLKNLAEVGDNGNRDEDDEQQLDQERNSQDPLLRCLLLHKNNSLHPALTRASCTEHHHYVCQIEVRRPIDITSLLTRDEER